MLFALRLDFLGLGGRRCFGMRERNSSSLCLHGQGGMVSFHAKLGPQLLLLLDGLKEPIMLAGR